jgi:hypothetical protein
MVVGEPVQTPGAHDGPTTCGVEADEKDPGLAAGRHVGANVELRKGRETRCRYQPSHAKPGQSEGNDPNPGVAVELVDLERRWYERAQRRAWNRPVTEQDVLPGLREEPAPLRPWPRPMRRLTEDRRLSGGMRERIQRLPRSAWSRSIASKSALKFPSPKLRAPWRSITSKKSVGRSCAGFVKICSR